MPPPQFALRCAALLVCLCACMLSCVRTCRQTAAVTPGEASRHQRGCREGDRRCSGSQTFLRNRSCYIQGRGPQTQPHEQYTHWTAEVQCPPRLVVLGPVKGASHLPEGRGSRASPGTPVSFVFDGRMNWCDLPAERGSGPALWTV